MPGQPFPVTQGRGLRIRQKTRDVLFALWDFKHMWCAARGHVVANYPSGYSYVLICRRCGGASVIDSEGKKP